MLGGADIKNIFFIENLKRALYKECSLSQYVKRGWQKKDLSTENLKRDLYEKASLTRYVWCGLHYKVQFKENARQDWHRKNFFNSIC